MVKLAPSALAGLAGASLTQGSGCASTLGWKSPPPEAGDSYRACGPLSFTCDFISQFLHYFSEPGIDSNGIFVIDFFKNLPGELKTLGIIAREKSSTFHNFSGFKEFETTNVTGSRGSGILCGLVGDVSAK